ncbi:dephospho-CoA kinase [Andreesenia angusta]|uniref:Dephospho-CoA kinase n=1 Tax=Andreesenia angusta TaxID=39480 RepID=A0A1S1V785_9FIRM|nr:dephospho-CoA kinase [Andreesenia angusta]OHW62486.1 dephospho-CoA kinase [Andreesenia angusta]
MKQNKLVGITGGIGTGKSLVSKYLLKKGYTVIDFDNISRNIYRRDKQAYSEILEKFGEGVLDSEGEVDRKKLAEIVFKDRKKLSTLNRITHRHIFEEAKEFISLSSDKNILFLDIPLLYEVREEIEKSGIRIDEVWFVYSDRELQIERVMKRDGIDYQSAVKRVDAQIPTDEKIKYADKIICNLGNEEEVYSQIELFLRQS